MKAKRCIRSRTGMFAAAFFTVVFVIFSWILANGNGRFSWDGVFEAFGLRTTSQAAKMPLSVHFIDVGQGDCVIVKCGDNSMLIDSGKQGNEQKIIRYLRNLNINKIDYAVATHPDSDHIGSMSEVIETFHPSVFMMPDIRGGEYAATDLFLGLLESAEQSGAKNIYAQAGKSYMLGSAVFTFLAPLRSYADINNMSAVIRLTYGETTFLLMGDAETQEEYDILRSGVPLKCDVIKAGHHGSRSSSSEELIRASMPRYAVISVGTHNDYGHPHREVVERFEEIGCEVIRTDYCSTIVFGSDGKTLILDMKNSAK